jgi:3-oxoacyl-[acyl-carrier protein] reductase
MQVALVTGAASGLGRQISLALSRNNYLLILNYHTSTKAAEDLLKEMHKRSVSIHADVKDKKQIKAMAEQIEERYGRLDVIVNNAGIIKDNLLLKQTETEWDNIIDTNLKGCFNVIKAMAPIMTRSGGGHIINISSYSGVRGKAGQSAYSASKAALMGLTFSAASEFAEYNIKVNALLPGYMLTSMGLTAQEAVKEAQKNSIINKLSNPEDVAKFIVYWLLADSSWLIVRSI